MCRAATAAVFALQLLATAAVAQPLYVLYDPAAGTLPTAQPWLAYADNTPVSGGTATQTFVAGQGARSTRQSGSSSARTATNRMTRKVAGSA